MDLALAWAPWILAGGAFLFWFVHLVEAGLSGWRPRLLSALPGDGPLPKLSVIVPALDEEGTIEPAMRTLIALDYPDLEIIAVDDRSTDATGAILDRLATQSPRLRVIHVLELPAGWLGKNHAMDAGAREATGEFILFTDADVHFAPDALRRAVRTMVDSKLDHLTAFPDLVYEGFWESLSVWFFGVMLALRFRMWKAADPRSRAHTGIGAFNMVRASVYRAMGGHGALAMEVVDDLKLGKKMKEASGRSEPVSGAGMVRVRWVVGVSGMVTGLTKNAFAGMGFRPILTLVAVVGQLYIVCWPYIGLAWGPWGARAICAAALASIVVLSWNARPAKGIPGWGSLLFPFASALLAYIMLRSMAITYAQGGVKWRGTLYPLAALRKGVV